LDSRALTLDATVQKKAFESFAVGLNRNEDYSKNLANSGPGVSDEITHLYTDVSSCETGDFGTLIEALVGFQFNQVDGAVSHILDRATTEISTVPHLVVWYEVLLSISWMGGGGGLCRALCGGTICGAVRSSQFFDGVMVDVVALTLPLTVGMCSMVLLPP
jgi:hypothetical protein